MSTYQCQHCNYKFTASNATQCPNCARTSVTLSSYRTQDDTDFLVNYLHPLAATNNSPTCNPCSRYFDSCSSSDSDSSSYSDSFSSSSSD